MFIYQALSFRFILFDQDQLLFTPFLMEGFLFFVRILEFIILLQVQITFLIQNFNF